RATWFGSAISDILSSGAYSAVRSSAGLGGVFDRFAVGVIQPVERAAAPPAAKRDLAGVVDRIGMEAVLIDGAVEVRERTQIRCGNSGQVGLLCAARKIDIS